MSIPIRLASSGPSRSGRCARTSTSSCENTALGSPSRGDGRRTEVRYSRPLVALTFDSIAEVMLARDLLRRWWGLELGLAAPDGSGYERTSHTTCATLRANGSG